MGKPPGLPALQSNVGRYWLIIACKALNIHFKMLLHAKIWTVLKQILEKPHFIKNLTNAGCPRGLPMCVYENLMCSLVQNSAANDNQLLNVSKFACKYHK